MGPKLVYTISVLVVMSVVMTMATGIVGIMPNTWLVADIEKIDMTGGKFDVTMSLKGDGIHQVSLIVGKPKSAGGNGVCTARLFHIYIHKPGSRTFEFAKLLKKKCLPLINDPNAHLTFTVSRLILGLEKRLCVHIGPGEWNGIVVDIDRTLNETGYH